MPRSAVSKSGHRFWRELSGLAVYLPYGRSSGSGGQNASGASSLTAFFEVSNIFAKENDCCIEYEVTDEEGEFDLETETNNYLPAIPSIGVIWRFGAKNQ
jgi:hypothetical protein